MTMDEKLDDMVITHTDAYDTIFKNDSQEGDKSEHPSRLATLLKLYTNELSRNESNAVIKKQNSSPSLPTLSEEDKLSPVNSGLLSRVNLGSYISPVSPNKNLGLWRNTTRQ